MERWKPVVGFEGLYEVSDHGRVRNVRPVRQNGTWPGRIVAGSLRKKGYRGVCLCKQGKQYSRDVQRLVGEAFLGPLPNGLQTDHIDGNKADSRLSNLQYVTGLENMRNSYEPQFHRHVPRGEEHPNAKLTEAEVVAIKEGLRQGLKAKELAARYGVERVTISAIKGGRLWRHVA